MRKKFIYIFFIWFLCGCSFVIAENEKTQEEILYELGIHNQNDFKLLEPCEQIEVYTNIGAQFLDIDHATAIVPAWVNTELSIQPRDKIATCIAEQGETVLTQLDTSNTNKDELNVFKIHALIYKADDLDIIKDYRVEPFVLSALCNENVDYRGRIAILYFAADQQDLYNFPEPAEIINLYCT